MPRFLTPGKICLLALIDTYLSGETASKARLAVLDFIASQIHAASRPGADVPVLADSLCYSAAEMLRPLSSWSSDKPGRTVYDVLLQRLWNIDTLDTLHVLFDGFSHLMSFVATSNHVRRGLSRASPLGQFVRRCCVEFTRLQFTDFQALWHSFVIWRASTHEAWAHKNPNDAARLAAPAEEALHEAIAAPVTDGRSASVSAEDSETILTFSIHQLQKLGTRLPNDVRGMLQTWINNQLDSGTQSLQHFLAFFEHWKSGQYTMALESLHRYFDYSLVAKSGSDNMKVYYQYALLHLSVLHADFDCWDESVESMDECIATARENQDTACLNFALSWLLYLRQARPSTQRSPYGSMAGVVGGDTGDQDEVAFLKTKAKETKHWSLLSSTLLDEAKIEMYRHGSTAKALEHIVQSSFLNSTHDLRTLMPVTNLFAGASLDRLGFSPLAGRMYEEVSVLHGNQSPITDRVRATCRIAYGNAQSGRYSEAEQMLEQAALSVQGILKLEQRVQGFAILVQMTRSLCRADVNAASHYLTKLQSLRNFSDPEIEFEVFLLEVELLLKRQEHTEAFTLVNARLRQLKTAHTADAGHGLYLLTLKCRILSACNQSPKAFSTAIRAVASSARLLLVPTFLEGLVALARVLNDLSEFSAAQRLLHACMPMIFESRQTRLLAQGLLILGESQVGIAGHENASGTTEQAQSMRTAEDYIERAHEVYTSLEDFSGRLECLCMKSQLANWRGDPSSASQADTLYFQLLADGQ
ncbi:hypothetical protein D0865_04965 [Hortaea werneckii]|uniref:Anaphase-promoting complex subunit 5 n=1 Tax=Hortaea werneckii TaxID=91943 RepID=A0A3M7CPL3_HORWE|nr:hypothetical protein D0865_04965 [Hortaea werneckii]